MNIKKQSYPQTSISTSIKIISAIINGMLGAPIYIIPILAYQTNFNVINFIPIIISGMLGFYSCFIYISHMGNQLDVDRMIKTHFNNQKWEKNIKILYSSGVVLYLLILLVYQFYLLVYHVTVIIRIYINFNSIWPYSIIYISIAIFLMCMALTIKRFGFGVNILSFGSISILFYCIFITYLAFSDYTFQNNYQKYTQNQSNNILIYLQQFSAFSNIFAIQTYFIPILRQAKSTKNDKKYITIIFSFSLFICLYVNYIGEKVIGRYLNQETTKMKIINIISIFTSPWIRTVLSCSYLIANISIYTQFLLICMHRFFTLLKLINKNLETNSWFEQSKQEDAMKKGQKVFSLFVILLGVITSLIIYSKFPLVLIFKFLNGFLLNPFFIYLIPFTIQIKCINAKRKSINLSDRNQSNLTVISYKQNLEQLQNNSNKLNHIQLSQSSRYSQNQHKNLNLNQKIIEKGNNIKEQQIQSIQTFKSGICNYQTYTIRKIIINFIGVFILAIYGLFVAILTVIGIANQ